MPGSRRWRRSGSLSGPPSGGEVGAILGLEASRLGLRGGLNVRRLIGGLSGLRRAVPQRAALGVLTPRRAPLREEGVMFSKRPMRIANFSGAMGDRFDAFVQSLYGDPVDVLFGDSMTEAFESMLVAKLLDHPQERKEFFSPIFLRQPA